MNQPAHPYKSDTHSERFYHFRLDQGDIGVSGSLSKFRAITVFARKDPITATWTAAVSLCVIGDQFSRHIGRQVARRRFFDQERNQRHYIGLDISYEKVKDLAKNQLEAILSQ